MGDCEIAKETILVSQHKNKRDPLCQCYLPSLLLVTGMLWTVRSLKQELVRTWSSTELNTHPWGSVEKKKKQSATVKLLHFCGADL